MKASEDDHIAPTATRRRSGAIRWLLVFAALAALIYFWISQREKPEISAIEQPPVENIAPQKAKPAPAPDIPRRTPPATQQESGMPVEKQIAVAPPLPTPQESDEIIRSELRALNAAALLDGIVEKEHPVDIAAALIDGLSRGVVVRKILPLQGPSEPFRVLKRGNTIVIDPANYERYDTYVESVSAFDTQKLVTTFHKLRPLLERSYATLGLDAEKFDNAVIQSLDMVLATPEIEGDVALERKSVHYTYADPELEGLTSLQKLLLRMGPDNIRRLKEQALELRDGLLVQ